MRSQLQNRRKENPTLSFRVPEEVFEFYNELATKQRVSLSCIVRNALEDHYTDQLAKQQAAAAAARVRAGAPSGKD